MNYVRTLMILGLTIFSTVTSNAASVESDDLKFERKKVYQQTHFRDWKDGDINYYRSDGPYQEYERKSFEGLSWIYSSVKNEYLYQKRLVGQLEEYSWIEISKEEYDNLAE